MYIEDTLIGQKGTEFRFVTVHFLSSLTTTINPRYDQKSGDIFAKFTKSLQHGVALIRSPRQSLVCEQHKKLFVFLPIQSKDKDV